MDIKKYYEIERNKKLHIYYKNEEERYEKRSLVKDEIQEFYNDDRFTKIKNKYKFIRLNEISKIIIQEAQKGKIKIEEELINELYPSTTNQITMLKQSRALKIIARKYKVFNNNEINSKIKRIKFIYSMLEDKEQSEYDKYFIKKREELRQEIFKYSFMPLKDVLSNNICNIY